MRGSIQPLNLAERRVAERVLDLQRAAYAVEAGIIGFDGIPQLHESLDELASSRECWLGLWENDELVAALSYQLEGSLLDICRLVVDPTAFRRGHGSSLVAEVRRTVRHESVIVSTGSANTPAVELYRKLGFEPVATREVAPGVRVTRFQGPRQPEQLLGWNRNPGAPHQGLLSPDPGLRCRPDAGMSRRT